MEMVLDKWVMRLSGALRDRGIQSGMGRHERRPRAAAGSVRRAVRWYPRYPFLASLPVFLRYVCTVDLTAIIMRVVIIVGKFATIIRP